MNVDPRFLVPEGREIFTGNELLLKGALEAEGGVHLLGGYPGSPIADFFNSMAHIKDLLSDKGIRAVINNNEALAAAMLNGSQTVGCRAIITMKSVGVHVAADALALGSLSGAHRDGGAIVVYGDDPWSDSTQVPSDSRYISKHLFIPVIEPSNPQEVKDFVDLALKVSRRSELYSGFILPTNLADGGGTVLCRPNHYPSFNTRQKVHLDTATIDLDKRVLLPPRTWWQEESYTARFARAVEVARELGLNRIEHAQTTRKPIGFVASGLAHAYLSQALWDMGLLGELPVLKLGMTYPMDAELVRRLADQCERIVVVEERRGFMEAQIGEILIQDRQAGRDSGNVELWGKRFPGGLEGIPHIRGLHPSMLIERLAPLLKRVNVGGEGNTGVAQRLDSEIRTVQRSAAVDVDKLPPRLPSFCPGCPHRDSANVCLEIKKRFMDAEYMKRKHHRGPVDLLFHGDTGCYTMLLFPPNDQLMHDYSGMGLGGGTGSGTDPFTTNKEVVFMGDSTFFHSGQLAIGQAVKLDQDITFILLDNSTTAMTGHQPTPGVSYDILGNPTSVQDIEDVVQSLAGDSGLTVVRVDPEKRGPYRALLEETFLADGVKVVIADKECGITRMRRKRREDRAVTRRRGFLPAWEHMNINQELCTFCMACAEITACPGLKHVQTDYGRRMDTDITWCVNDGACERLGACSAFEHVTIKRKRPPRSRVPELGLDDIPEPAKRPPGDLWRCCLAGVGGMGLGVATSIIVRAGHKEGYDVVFLDKKGLAIRNGGTVSQVAYNIASEPITALVPYGKADLLIGIDVLEAARALDPAGRTRAASTDRTAAVINTDKINTIPALMGTADFDVDELEKVIRANTRTDDYLARNISRICEKYLGSKLYANIMMLGFAFQKGLIPVSMHSMAWAIKDTIRTDFRKNLYAFNMGRKLVVQRDLFQGPPARTDWADVLEEKCRWTIRRYRNGQEMAGELRELIASTVNAVRELDGTLKRDIVIRAYDCMRWGGLDYARRYADGVTGVYKADKSEYGFAATRAVVHNLANAMLIPDGVYMAELATSPEKRTRDREKYGVNVANGDRIVYRHLWHTDLPVGKWKVPLRLNLPSWPLQLLKRSRYLRKLLPNWHKAQRNHLADYESHLAAFSFATAEEYAHGVASLSSARCLSCMIPLCQEAGCPLGSPIPEWVELAYRGHWDKAAELLYSRNNFPEITSRICPAACQDSCKQGKNDFPVQIRDLERRIADRAMAETGLTPAPAPDRTHKRVAVVGSGPAGLAAAQQLARSGHDVVVFEKDSLIGGLLRWGIPEFRLERSLVDARVAQMRAEGVEFRTAIEVGKDVSAAELAQQFDAILLATGALVPRSLDVPGCDKPGIRQALDFLREFNDSSGADSQPASNKVVAVIGGGETGNDCVEAALHQGARQVHQLEILPKAQADLKTWTYPEAPNVHRQWCVATKRFGGDGQVSHLQAVQVSWRHSGKTTTMQQVPESEFTIEADLVLLATGFDAVVSPAIADQLGLETADDGRVVLKDAMTNVPGVFAAGDLATGASLVAGAIDSGRRAAAKIDAYLATMADATT